MSPSRPPLTYVLFLAISKATPSHASRRFHQWFPDSVESFAEVSTNVCNATLRAYQNLYDSYDSKAWIDLGLHTGRPIFELCKNHESCILENVSEAAKASMATSGVVLGLLPTLLAVLSPSISEVALLAAQRPLLASLISLGSPGLLQTRIFEYTDPSEHLDLPEERSDAKMIRTQLALGPWPKGIWSICVSAVEYILVLACIVNTVDLAIRLSHRAILSWGCTRTWPTIVWAIVPVVIQLIASIGYRLTLNHQTQHQSATSSREASDKSKTAITSTAPSRAHSFFSRPENFDTKYANQATVVLDSDAPAQRLPSQNPSTSFQRLTHWLLREWTPCATHPVALPSRVTNFLPHPSTRVTVGVLMYCMAGFLAFFHLLYGTVTFSGLLFISPLDSIGQITMRFLVSALICRFVTLTEIAGMRGTMLAARQAREREG